ncbi:small acid-soluble spore protein H (minor) [Evansella caseinilytica]|uniref:Small, acid-soluble spore protein H n=1 Tax=Evansella caseinilytica TaxID=1503961 RepID=A0A1H3RB90_9BACI|nr:H-type small acid-soluble spore protein [Evansella caseinilytica]SDZ23092.1 small acid-soluble spore protein H (minor) [Evansella caseinilytica]
MNTQRAKEIALSPVLANVEYQGSRVYIQNVDDSGIARVYSLNDPGHEFDVQVTDLTEK